jgi:hypothetical protein
VGALRLNLSTNFVADVAGAKRKLRFLMWENDSEEATRDPRQQQIQTSAPVPVLVTVPVPVPVPVPVRVQAEKRKREPSQ